MPPDRARRLERVLLGRGKCDSFRRPEHSTKPWSVHSEVGARRVQGTARQVPPDRLLAETDAPDQAPHPHRGERSEPAYLVHVLAAMGRALGEPLEAVARRTTENARRLFPRSP